MEREKLRQLESGEGSSQKQTSTETLSNNLAANIMVNKSNAQMTVSSIKYFFNKSKLNQAYWPLAEQRHSIPNANIRRPLKASLCCINFCNNKHLGQ